MCFLCFYTSVWSHRSRVPLLHINCLAALHVVTEKGKQSIDCH